MAGVSKISLGDARKVLLICGHPDLSSSSFSRHVLGSVDRQVFAVRVLADHGVRRFVPDEELSLIANARQVVFLFPVHWYGVPSLLKRWTEEALCKTTAVDPHKIFRDKCVRSIVSAGGLEEDYAPDGKNCQGLSHYLSGFEMTFRYFGAHVDPARLFYGTYRLSRGAISQIGRSLSQDIR